MPTLDIVIAMLERFIVREKGLTSVDALYERLAMVDHSVRLPFSMPLEQLSIYLSHVGISRGHIADTFLLRPDDAAARSRAHLGTLPKAYAIITTSRLGNLSANTIKDAEAYYAQWLELPNLTLSVIAGETETDAWTRSISPRS